MAKSHASRFMAHNEAQSHTPIRPYHAFSVENAWYVINRDRFAFERVPRAFIGFLEALGREPATPVSEANNERLRRLKLIVPRVSGTPLSTKAPQEISIPPVASATVFVTQKCNHRCIYCYGGDGEYGDPGIMDEETGFKTLEWLWAQRGDLTSMAISFFGGEPLLNFQLVRKMVAHARKLEEGSKTRFKFTLATNAALLDDSMPAFMQANDFYALVGFDGPKKIQDRNRPLRNGGSSYEAVIPRIKKLIKTFPNRVTLRSTIWKKGDIPDVVREMRSLNPHIFQTQVASPGGHQGRDAPEPTADGRDVVAAVGQMIPEFLKAVHEKDLVTLSSLTKWLSFNGMLGVIARRFKRTGSCGVGAQTVSVSSRGIIYPCHRFVGHDHYAIGNIATGELNRAIYLDPPLLTSPQCNVCWAKHLCNGGCIYDHLARTGKRFTPHEGFCRMTKALFEMGIHLAHQLTAEQKEFLYGKRIVTRPLCPLDLV